MAKEWMAVVTQADGSTVRVSPNTEEYVKRVADFHLRMCAEDVRLFTREVTEWEEVEDEKVAELPT